MAVQVAVVAHREQLTAPAELLHLAKDKTAVILHLIIIPIAIQAQAVEQVILVAQTQLQHVAVLVG
jgi:hypothetical protein